MNITFPTMKTSYRPASPVQPRRAPRTEKSRGDYDTVNIRRAPAPEDDETFARMLARKTAAQMGSVSPERVTELQSRVAGGTYTPDPQRIAGRMLGLG